MKHKKLFRSVTALLAALVLMGGFSVTAFAGGGDVSDEPPTPVTETEPEETTGGYEPQPLTPEGNMSLVDDITGEASGDKQFITVVTKNGNYFYIIIDRAEDGENTVHFLNQVDEKDLLQLMEDEQTETPACSCTEKCVAGSINTDCPVCSVNMSECAGKEAEPELEETEQPEPEEDKGGGMGGAILLVVLLLAAAGGGAFYYKEFLTAMSKFHDYSLNNTILIAMQGGNLVKGYSQWQKEFDRHVKSGEKGIKIFAPAPYKVKKLVDKIDPDTRKPILDSEGKTVKEEKEVTVPAFKVVTVFDISQTEGKEFPDLSVKPLLADVEQYEDFFAALEKASPVPIAFEQITNGANGYFSLTDKRIAIKEGVSELQAVKTAIHEIAHAKLHDVDLNAPPEQQNRVDRHTCEVEAESVAYTVCQHFGLDTSDYSFGYVAGWSSGKEMTELKASLETIQTTAKELITEIEGHFTELQQQRQAEQEQGDTFSIYQLKRGDETRDLRFEPYDRLQAAGLTIDRVNYELVYTAPLTKDMTLGDIWERFNIDHPADFKGHSLSVSDIVVLHQNDEDTAHYVDSIGFQQVPEFLQEQQTPVFDKLPPEQQQALSDTVQDTLQMLVDADKRIYGDVTGKTLEAIAAQGYSYKDGQLEKQQPEATPDSLLTGETVRTPRGNFHITDMSREQIEAAGFGFHHASEDGKYLIMGNGTQAYAIAAEQPQRDNPLKHVEDTIEQNDNNFDGLINNTPQTPTVADFEQRAKAGEAISVTDLAKAVKAEKREQPQKKPSILKKLDEYKKQAAQQPKDKQKEHKKDLEV